MNEPQPVSAGSGECIRSAVAPAPGSGIAHETAGGIVPGSGGEQLRLWYQPRVSLADNTLTGFEALLRWEHPTRGMVSPGQIIPLAEDTGLIVPIGWWVIEAACKQLAKWTAALNEHRAAKVSVNLSKKQLFEPGFAERVTEMIERYGVEPWRLNLEVTESTIISGGEKVQQVLRNLHGAGLSLWIDDFGTGASSLSCLHQYPLSVLKLTRSSCGIWTGGWISRRSRRRW